MNRRWNWLRGLEWVLAANRPVVTPGDLRGLRSASSAAVRCDDSGASGGRAPARWRCPGRRSAPPSGRRHRRGAHPQDPSLPTGVLPPRALRVAAGGPAPGSEHGGKRRQIPDAAPAIQNALRDACDAAGDFFSRALRQAEAENEALNIAPFKAAYLKVTSTPGSAAVARARADLLGEGLLDSETAAVVAAAEPPMKGKPAP